MPHGTHISRLFFQKARTAVHLLCLFTILHPATFMKEIFPMCSYASDCQAACPVSDLFLSPERTSLGAHSPSELSPPGVAAPHTVLHSRPHVCRTAHLPSHGASRERYTANLDNDRDQRWPKSHVGSAVLCWKGVPLLKKKKKFLCLGSFSPFNIKGLNAYG